MTPRKQDTHVELTIFFSDREPAGPYSVLVPARRPKHLRFNDLREPERFSSRSSQQKVRRVPGWGCGSHMELSVNTEAASGCAAVRSLVLRFSPQPDNAGEAWGYYCPFG
ncbi:MAG: hypothetical protein DMG72_24810 [Acidobacteria bacterium]|nr:MAG: hypothetical protein DMG72_24810 [Acidobacteriota bacterium]